MNIIEYLNKCPGKYDLSEIEDIEEFYNRVEYYLDFCNDLVPYDNPNYVNEVFDMSVRLALKDIEDFKNEKDSSA